MNESKEKSKKSEGGYQANTTAKVRPTVKLAKAVPMVLQCQKILAGAVEARTYIGKATHL
jgi:hypothetical protein